MNIKTRKILICVFCAFLLISICTVSLITFGAFNKSYAEELILSEEINSSYMVGDKVKIPAGKIKHEGKDYPATVKVFAPDNSDITNASVRFQEKGNYKLVYTAKTDDDFNITSSKIISVYGEKYSVNTPAASVQYKEHLFYSVSHDGNYADNKSTYTEDRKIGGLYVTLPENSVFRYNKVVNIAGKTKDDNLIKLNIVANENGKEDFGSVVVRFTDAYDLSNYVDVVLWISSTNNPTNYMRAGASNQRTSGYNKDDKKLFVDKYGICVRCSLANRPFYGGSQIKDTMDVSMDYENRIVYGIQRGGYDGEIIDLDNPEYFKNLWNGFTTGECYVSVFADKYFTGSGNIFIQSIVDEPLEEFKDNILYDDEAPQIEVDYGDYSKDNLPYGTIGNKYPLFSAEAMDLNGKISTFNKKVYFDYNTENQKEYQIKDNCFVPDKNGEYVIEYSAVDYYGNKAVTPVTITCKTEEQSFSVDLVGESVKNGTTGQYIDISNYNIKGGSGKVSINIKAVSDKASYDISLEDMKFRPLKEGVYKIIYTAKDYTARTIEKSYNVDVKVSEKAVFLEDVVLPMYYIAGTEQVVPELDAYDFNKDSYISTEIFVKEGANPERKLENGKFIPVYDGDNKDYNIKITYRATVNGKVTEKVYDNILCRNIFINRNENLIDKSKLFVEDEGVVSTYEKIDINSMVKTKYAVYTATEDAGLNYVNAVPAHDFDIRFNIFEDSNFNKLSVYMTDAMNRNVKVKVTFIKDGQGLMLSINDGLSYKLKTGSFNNQQAGIYFKYDNIYHCLYADDSKLVVDINDTMGKEEFNGFESGKIYFRVSMEEVSGKSKIAVQTVHNQLFSDNKRDTSDPIISVTGNYDKLYSLNDKVKILKSVYLDMIDPYIPVSLTVLDPAGNVMTGTDGVKLENVNIEKEYEIVADSYGKYTIRYNLEFGVSIDYYFSVIDEVKPELSVQTTYKDEYKVGDIVELKATATDAISGECKVYAYFVTPSNVVVDLEVNKKLMFTEKGRHILTFWTMDEIGNYVEQTFRFEVKEK